MALAGAGANIARAEEFNAFQVAERRVRETVHTIALRPVRVPSDAPDRARLREQLEGFVAEALRQGGFQVVASAEFAPLWRANAEKLGGIYDAKTGTVDDQKFELCSKYVGRELAARHRVDAILTTAILYDEMGSWIPPPLSFDKKAHAAGEVLMLHGEPVEEPILHQKVQLVVGSFVAVWLTDLDGTILYGVQSPVEWSKVFASRSYDVRPNGEFQNVERLQRAVEITLDQLVHPKAPEAEAVKANVTAPKPFWTK